MPNKKTYFFQWKLSIQTIESQHRRCCCAGILARMRERAAKSILLTLHIPSAILPRRQPLSVVFLPRSILCEQLSLKIARKKIHERDSSPAFRPIFPLTLSIGIEGHARQRFQNEPIMRPRCVGQWNSSDTQPLR